MKFNLFETFAHDQYHKRVIRNKLIAAIQERSVLLFSIGL